MCSVVCSRANGSDGKKVEDQVNQRKNLPEGKGMATHTHTHT